MVTSSILVLGLAALLGGAQEDDGRYWRVETYALPEGVVLEVGGIAVLAEESLFVCTRRGEVWAIGGPPAHPHCTLWADGLQEPLGLLVHDGWIYTAQRGELSRMRDTDADGRMDELETVCDGWEISGNYHEYNFGPRLGPDGRLWITTNKPFGEEPFGSVPWRGFALAIGFDGSWQPMCAGLRSPAGIQPSPDGTLFYTDNQGEWCGASKLSALRPGRFYGHPWGRSSCELPEWKFDVPPEPPNEVLMPRVSDSVPTFELPAVWFPYDKLGRSPSGLAWDPSEGLFGPYAGQAFVGDQYAAMVMRVALEEVEGHWQGACFPFVGGLASGVTRVAFTPAGALLVGMTDRGWPALGRKPYGLERLTWTGRTPFEVRSVRVRRDGFTLEFTAPVERESAVRPSAYALSSYTYLLHETYGSDEVDARVLAVESASVSPDGFTVELVVPGLREGYVHELHYSGVRAQDARAPWHDVLYYTLIERPPG